MRCCPLMTLPRPPCPAIDSAKFRKRCRETWPTHHRSSSLDRPGRWGCLRHAAGRQRGTAEQRDASRGALRRSDGAREPSCSVEKRRKEHEFCSTDLWSLFLFFDRLKRLYICELFKRPRSHVLWRIEMYRPHFNARYRGCRLLCFRQWLGGEPIMHMLR